MKKNVKKLIKRTATAVVTTAVLGTSFPAVNFAEELSPVEEMETVIEDGSLMYEETNEEPAAEIPAEEHTEAESVPETEAEAVPETEAEEVSETEIGTVPETESICDDTEDTEAPEEVSGPDESEEPESEFDEAEVNTETAEEEESTETDEELETDEQVLQAEVIKTYRISDTIIAELDADGVFTVSGTGAIPDYESTIETPWYSDSSEKSSVKKIVIGEGITRVGNLTFNFYTNEQVEVIIADSVRSIGESAFSAAEVTSISGMRNVEILERYAFYQCSIKEFPSMPNLKTIGDDALGNALESLTVPAGVTSIGNLPGSLKTISVDPANSVYKSVDNVLLSKDGKVLVRYPMKSTAAAYTVPDGVVTIGSHAFSCDYFDYTASLAEVTLPSSVTTIELSAFNNCVNLTSLVIPSSVTTIGDGAFTNCKRLTSMTVPSSVTTLGIGVFTNCIGLTSLVVNASVEEIPGFLAENCSNLKSVDLSGSTARSIGYRSFSDCENLSEVKLPGNLERIMAEAFFESTKLAKPEWPSSLSFISTYVFTYYDWDYHMYISYLPEESYPSWLGKGNNDYYTLKGTPHVIYWRHTEFNVPCEELDGSELAIGSLGINYFGAYLESSEEISGGIRYRGFLQSKDWTEWAADGDGLEFGRDYMGGQIGLFEAFEIELTGDAADKYDVLYSACSEKAGWTDWVKNGATVGAAGSSDILTSIRVKLVQKEEEPIPFNDVPVTHPYYKEIADMYQRGLMTGLTPDNFGVETTLNRAFLAAVLYRRAGSPAMSYDNRFPDVKSGDWFTPSVMWASSSGMIYGYANGKFGPTDDLTREQLCTILMRSAANVDGYNTSARASLSGFADGANVSGYAKDAVQWCVATGIMMGSNGRLNPWNPVTRGEFAVMMSRYLQVVGK